MRNLRCRWLQVRIARARALVDARNPHLRHQPTYPAATYHMSKPLQVPRHLPAAVPRTVHERLVDHPHQRQGLLALEAQDVIIGGPG